MTSSAKDKFAPYVGLAQRANAVLYGEDIILERLKLAKVVLIDSEASAKYRDRLSSKINNCPVYTVDNLKQALHKDNVNAVAIVNAELAKAIIDSLR